MLRYRIDGHIIRKCPICEKTRNLICYTDKLTGESNKGCKDCLIDQEGIEIEKVEFK